jgi:hypothetical protein
MIVYFISYALRPWGIILLAPKKKGRASLNDGKWCCDKELASILKNYEAL